MKRTFIIVWMVLLFHIIMLQEVLAASATITIEGNKEEITVGETVSVLVTIDSKDKLGEFETFFSYDASLLEFVSGGSLVKGEDGILKISDKNKIEPQNSKSYSMKFKAIAAGSCEFGLSGAPSVYTFEDKVAMSASSNRFSLLITAAEKGDTNCDLENISVTPGTLYPTFHKAIMTYTITVEYNIDKLDINTITDSKKASVFLAGNENFQVGENTVSITVKAESGRTKVYTIIVTRKEKEIATEEEKDIEKEKEEKSIESEKRKILHDSIELEEDDFQIIKQDGMVFLTNTNTYEIVELEDTPIPAGYIETKLILYGESVIAYTLKNDLENDFLLFYCENQQEEKHFYQYDRVEKTLQRYVSTSDRYQGSSTISNSSSITNDVYQTSLQQLSLIIAVLSALVVLLLILVITIYMKQKGYKSELD